MSSDEKSLGKDVYHKRMNKPDEHAHLREALAKADAGILSRAKELIGNAAHERVDDPGFETFEGVKSERALPVWSDKLGLVGKCDVVEFHPNGSIYPVEYKHGKKRAQAHDDLQLAAQAICLEEMFGKPVEKGAIYHHSSRRRREVAVTSELRQQVEGAISAIRAMLTSGKLPPPANDARCKECSLNDICQPQAMVRTAGQKLLVAELFNVDESEVRHAAYSKEGALHSSHFFPVQRGKRAIPEARAVERPRLVHNDLAILQQPPTRPDSYPPLRECGVNLGGHGQNDNHRCSDCGKRIVLQYQYRTDFADLPPARRVQVGDPDFTAPHHFHHFSFWLADFGLPALRPSTASNASFSAGRNSSEISSASRRIFSFEYAARASSTSWFMNRLLSISLRYQASASRATSERVRFSRCASRESCWSTWSGRRKLSVDMMDTFLIRNM